MTMPAADRQKQRSGRWIPAYRGRRLAPESRLDETLVAVTAKPRGMLFTPTL